MDYQTKKYKFSFYICVLCVCVDDQWYFGLCDTSQLS